MNNNNIGATPALSDQALTFLYSELALPGFLWRRPRLGGDLSSTSGISGPYCLRVRFQVRCTHMFRVWSVDYTLQSAKSKKTDKASLTPKVHGR